MTKFCDYFSAIDIPNSLKNDVYINGEPVDLLEYTSKLNLFVGANNSGKSLLMREILKSQKLTERLSETAIQAYNEKISEWNNRILRNFQTGYNTFKSNHLILEKVSLAALFNPLARNESLRDKLRTLRDKILELHGVDFHTGTTPGYNDRLTEGQARQIKQDITSIKLDLDKFKNEIVFDKCLNRIYIPTLRTLRILGNGNVCENLTRKEYDLDTPIKTEPDGLKLEKIIVENGESFYKNAFHLINSDYKGKVKMQRFEEFLSENFFENKKILILTDATNNVIKIKIGTEQEQPIHNLGDGLQMAIILTFPLFNYENGMLFIEEPELFLHPGFQRKIIDIFANHSASAEFMIFIVTHSNHILDSSIQQANSSVYSFKKMASEVSLDSSLPKFEMRLLQYGDSSILTSLGVANTSVFLSNCILWVEGVTDRLYLSRMMQEYLKSPICKLRYSKCQSFQEGISFSFVFSGGDNIIHYEFSDELLIKDISKKAATKYLCKNSLVIVDDDDQKNIVRKNQLKSQLGFKFFELPVIEVESLLSFDTIVRTIKTFPSWQDLDISKHEYIAPEFYRKKRLGSLIDDNILSIYPKTYKKGRKNFATKATTKNKNNLTLNCKYQFCENSLPHITDVNLTPNAVKCVEKVLDFIMLHN